MSALDVVTHPLVFSNSSNELPDLRRVGIISLDLETRDDRLRDKMGSGWPFRQGYICGVSAAWREGNEIRSRYFSLRHPDTDNFDPDRVYQWLRDHFASDARILTQNGLYDFGWLRAEADIRVPPSERLEDTLALAVIVDENRHSYSLDNLCGWRGLPGKDKALLNEAAQAIGLPKRAKPVEHLWEFPARYMAPYAKADVAATLALFENLHPILNQEGTEAAYRLEIDLLPMVHEMRRRGIRINVPAAEQARDLFLGKRDAALSELSEKLGTPVTMEELNRNEWREETFDKHAIAYPRTEKGNSSFTAGNLGWMPRHPHWLPQLIVKADRYHNAGRNFLQRYIIDHVVDGRIHGEIRPHRSDEGGTRSSRFSYSDPPLQLMPGHDEEFTSLIRGVFLPEEGEIWSQIDFSQQEYRYIVHYAAVHGFRGAQEAADRYRTDPKTDFHAFVAGLAGIERQAAKAVNFAKSFGAGPRKFADMIRKSEKEARELYARYDHALPFVSQLAEAYQNLSERKGYVTLIDGTRRHFNQWALYGVEWTKGTGPCSWEEAERRISDPEHPWYKASKTKLYRADTYKAMNALIQGSAARHTKLWMRACWREGVVPLLQMHDALELSVSTKEQAEFVAQIGCEMVDLEVPMRAEVKFGRSWGDAEHTWEKLHGMPELPSEEAPPMVPTAAQGEPVKAADADEPPWEDAAGEASEAAVEPLEELILEAEEEPAATLLKTLAEELLARGINLPDTGPGRYYTTCPECSPERKPEHQNAEVLGVTITDNGGAHWGCNHCDWTGGFKTATPSALAGNVFYDYRDENGVLLFQKVRTPDKNFWQRVPDGKNGWINKLGDTRRVLYRLPEVRKAIAEGRTVVIVEGEKDVDNLWAVGIAATCNPEGASKPGKKSKWRSEYSEMLRGADLLVTGDDDAAGRAHVAAIAAMVAGTVKRVRVLDPNCWRPGKDVSDWLDVGHTRQEFDALLPLPATEKPLVISSAQFIKGFVPPDYLVEGLIQRRFIYALTARTGDGKTSVAMLLAACVALGIEFASRPTEKGRVLMFAGENPDDIRARWIGLAETMKFDVDTIDVHFIPGRFSIPEMAPRISVELEALGGVALLIIDTSAVYFEGDDENSNTQLGEHARTMRNLVDFPGGPCVVVNCHPIKNAPDDNLLPRGGGAFIAEIDGNLTLIRDATVATLHWQGKFRGPDFLPMIFGLITETYDKLRDSKGRLMPTVVAQHLTDAAEEELTTAARSDDDAVMDVLAGVPRSSLADIAEVLRWTNAKGEPDKSKVQRALNRLKKAKLVSLDRGAYTVTPKGEHTVKKQKKDTEAAETPAKETTKTTGKKGKNVGK